MASSSSAAERETGAANIHRIRIRIRIRDKDMSAEGREEDVADDGPLQEERRTQPMFCAFISPAALACTFIRTGGALSVMSEALTMALFCAAGLIVVWALVMRWRAMFSRTAR